MADLNEYGRDAATLPTTVPRPVVADNGRPSLTLVQLLQRVLTDSRMGRRPA